MNRFEILDRMVEILNEKVRSIIPGMINCYLIQAPVRKVNGEFVDVHITARGLIWNDYLGGVAKTYRVNDCFLFNYGDFNKEEYITTPELWERFERIAKRDIEEMLLKLTQMIKEYKEEEQAWKKQQIANHFIMGAINEEP
jgi:hypothetical protein